VVGLQMRLKDGDDRDALGICQPEVVIDQVDMGSTTANLAWPLQPSKSEAQAVWSFSSWRKYTRSPLAWMQVGS
jgi:hypothetical protein